MLENIEQCTLCAGGKVQRVPSLSFSVVKQNSAGKLVKEFIEEATSQVEREKVKLKEEYHGD